MVIHESSVQGKEVCKALGLEFGTQYKYADNNYIVFHEDGVFTSNYPLLLNLMLGKYTLIPIHVMERKDYDFKQYERIVNNLPKNTFKCMQTLISNINHSIPQDITLDFATDNAQIHIDCLYIDLYIPYVREALNTNHMDIEDINDVYYACVKYVFMNIMEIMFYTEMYNRLVGELNNMHKIIDNDVLERIVHGIDMSKEFELEYRKALDKLVEA